MVPKTSMRIAVVVGNPKPASRTLRVALAVAGALEHIGQQPADVVVIDLAEYANEIFDFESAVIAGLLGTVAESDVVVAASPTYKATYTGLLKGFLDRYGANALAGTLCIPIMTGAAAIHALAPEVHLRPLLVELGASTPTRGLFVTEDQLAQLDAVVATWADTARPLVATALGGTTDRPDHQQSNW